MVLRNIGAIRQLPQKIASLSLMSRWSGFEVSLKF